MEEVMNGLHHLVASGKVLYLVSPHELFACTVFGDTDSVVGGLGYSCLDRVQSKPVRTAHGEDALRHLPGGLEHHAARL